mgnify:CR=1 FL=1
MITVLNSHSTEPLITCLRTYITGRSKVAVDTVTKRLIVGVQLALAIGTRHVLAFGICTLTRSAEQRLEKL